MSSEPAQTTGSTETTAALGELARALRRVAEGSSLDDALRSIADATLVAAAADVVVVRVMDDEGGAHELPAGDLLRLGGDALASGFDEERTTEGIARLAVQGTGARSAAVWRLDDDLQPRLAGAFGSEEPDERGVVEALGATTA